MIQTVDGKRYYAHPWKLGYVEGAVHWECTPVTLITEGGDALNASEIEKHLEYFRTEDDVFSPAFEKTYLIQKRCQSEAAFGSDRSDSLVLWVLPSEELLPSGPYFLDHGHLHQAWRLYEDTLNAFVVPVIPENPLRPERFGALSIMSMSGIWQEVAVPSRLYNVKSESKPLGGIRVAIKDLYYLRGVQTTLSSRDWVFTHPVEAETAEYVEHLLALGAVIIGKTATSSFAGPDWPTDNWIDFHCPFNPRGDGYLNPAGSSVGAATALAGYDWFDVSLGTDSGGSIRTPATENGVFGLRTTWGAIPVKGVQAASPSFDVVGILTHSLEKMSTFLSASVQLQSYAPRPTKIIYPTDYFPQEDSEWQGLIDQFVRILEEFLNCKKTTLNIVDEWRKNPPDGIHELDANKYLEKSGFWPYCYEFYQAFDEFRQRTLKHLGRQPYAPRGVAYRWYCLNLYTLIELMRKGYWQIYHIG